jgi:hypothetical protein
VAKGLTQKKNQRSGDLKWQTKQRSARRKKTNQDRSGFSLALFAFSEINQAKIEHLLRDFVNVLAVSLLSLTSRYEADFDPNVNIA